jgi:hypothetical protein
MSSTDFSFQNLVFWNLFEFSAARNRLKINISHILNPNQGRGVHGLGFIGLDLRCKSS